MKKTPCRVRDGLLYGLQFLYGLPEDSFGGAQARRFLTFLLKPVGLLKFRQLCNDLAVFQLGLLCDGRRSHGVVAKQRRQLAAKEFGK